MPEIPVTDGSEERGGAEETQAPAEEMEQRDDLQSRIEELEKENAALKEGRLRAVAELDNARRRSQNEVLNAARYANEDLLKKLLPILDNFHRSIESGAETKDFEAFYQGVAMIRDLVSKTLGEVGVKRIETVGKEFDVDFHEALMRQPSDEPEGTILQELEPGYLYKDKVIRHAKVVVAA